MSMNRAERLANHATEVTPHDLTTAQVILQLPTHAVGKTVASVPERPITLAGSLSLARHSVAG